MLSACHESGGILIRIVDDGRGVRRDRVLARARERGLLEQGVTPPDDEILKLIFEPGLSTAETVTNLSGRGVGMDVVRRNIEALRGTVTIRSEPGAGSAIEIRLPLTLAIIDEFMIGVGPSKFIFPLESVVEVIENRRIESAVDARGRSVVELHGQVLPVVGLRALYGLDGAEPERSSIVVLKASDQHYGVRVDALLGQHQTVIKPLGQMQRSETARAEALAARNAAQAAAAQAEAAMTETRSRLADIEAELKVRTQIAPGGRHMQLRKAGGQYFRRSRTARRSTGTSLPSTYSFAPRPTARGATRWRSS